MSHIINDLTYERCFEWIIDNGGNPNQILKDDKGNYYVILEEETGFRKAILPSIYQTLSL